MTVQPASSKNSLPATARRSRKRRVIAWLIAVGIIAVLALGGTLIWRSMRAGITDEPLEAGIERAKTLGFSILTTLDEAGLSTDAIQLLTAGKGSCGAVGPLASTSDMCSGSTNFTRPVQNDEIVELLGIGDLPGWRTINNQDYEAEIPKGVSKGVRLTNGDLYVHLIISGQPETGEPFFSFNISTSCYNNSTSNIDVYDYGAYEVITPTRTP